MISHDFECIGSSPEACLQRRPGLETGLTSFRHGKSRDREKLMKMQWLGFQRWLLIVFLLCGTIAVMAQQKNTASHLQPPHSEAVKQWLTSNKLALRVATVADNSNKEGLAITRKERGKSYHPYYEVGDFNGDRKQDFAIALISERKRKEPFAIAIFNGPIGKNSVPAYLEEGWGI
ncbi:MAG: hypothetical protein ABR568_00840 [Pyrinomonadaceae bacterium]